MCPQILIDRSPRTNDPFSFRDREFHRLFCRCLITVINSYRLYAQNCIELVFRKWYKYALNGSPSMSIIFSLLLPHSYAPYMCVCIGRMNAVVHVQFFLYPFAFSAISMPNYKTKKLNWKCLLFWIIIITRCWAVDNLFSSEFLIVWFFLFSILLSFQFVRWKFQCYRAMNAFNCNISKLRIFFDAGMAVSMKEN